MPNGAGLPGIVGRVKLGDDDRRLIKTVPRRGYLLDVAVSAQASPSGGGAAVEMPELPQKLVPAPALRRRSWRAIAAHGLRIWGAVAAGVAGAALIFLFGRLPVLVDPSPVSQAESASAAQQWRPTLKDCADCPEAVALPAGEFMMGSPKDEPGRRSTEGLPRRVVIPKRIAIGKFEVTVDQFSAFVAETGMAVGNACQMIVQPGGGSSRWGPPEASFRQPGFEVSGSQPVVCISLA